MRCLPTWPAQHPLSRVATRFGGTVPHVTALHDAIPVATEQVPYDVCARVLSDEGRLVLDSIAKFVDEHNLRLRERPAATGLTARSTRRVHRKRPTSGTDVQRSASWSGGFRRFFGETRP
jgi:hypothetical protein